MQARDQMVLCRKRYRRLCPSEGDCAKKRVRESESEREREKKEGAQSARLTETCKCVQPNERKRVDGIIRLSTPLSSSEIVPQMPSFLQQSHTHNQNWYTEIKHTALHSIGTH